MVLYCRLVNLSETEMVKSWPEMENPGVIAQANLEALVIKRLSWPRPDQPLGLGIHVPPRHGHLKLMIDAISHLRLGSSQIKIVITELRNSPFKGH